MAVYAKANVRHSDVRVKSVDLHPDQAWLLMGLYDGTAAICNYKTSESVRTFSTGVDKPVRSAKFIARESWIVTGSDDGQIRVFDSLTGDFVKSFQAHIDFIRSVAVHPTKPLILTAGDDKAVKLWNWEQDWQCVKTFHGHEHYIMQVVFEPTDANSFATASLDTTVKIWRLDSETAIATLQGHEQGVNTVGYLWNKNGRSLLVSGGDDKLIKVWNMENQTCIATLIGHEQNVTSVLGVSGGSTLISVSEDGTVKVWNGEMFVLDETANYGLQRGWAMALENGAVAIGFDRGTVVRSESTFFSY